MSSRFTDDLLGWGGPSSRAAYLLDGTLVLRAAADAAAGADDGLQRRALVQLDVAEQHALLEARVGALGRLGKGEGVGLGLGSG